MLGPKPQLPRKGEPRSCVPVPSSLSGFANPVGKLNCKDGRAKQTCLLFPTVLFIAFLCLAGAKTETDKASLQLSDSRLHARQIDLWTEALTEEALELCWGAKLS